jgi:hypothetical protein
MAENGLLLTPSIRSISLPSNVSIRSDPAVKIPPSPGLLRRVTPDRVMALGRIYLAALQSQVAVSQDLLQEYPCIGSIGGKQVSPLKAGETAQACDNAC